MKPLLSAKPGSVQRTLIVTTGELAQLAGDQFVELLKKRHGPEAAIAVVSGSASDVDYLTAVSDALTHISPPDLATQLTANGWTIAHVDEVSLILLMDVIPDGAALAEDRLQAITTVIQQQIGVEATSLLIWLVGDDGETTPTSHAFAGTGSSRGQAVSDCLLPHISVTRGVIPLSLRNEAGLRLANNEALSAICAELLWVLTATPLHSLPEWVVEQSNYAFSDHPPLLSVGIAGWEWSPAATHAAFVNRWLESVLAHWLADANTGETEEGVAAWLQVNHISQDAFAAAVLTKEEKHLPKPVFASWHIPLPWHLRALVTETLSQADSDIEACEQWRKVSCLQLNESVQQATAVLRQHIEFMLDQQPVAGISRIDLWLEKVMEVCEQQIEQLLDQAERQAETENMLTTHQDALQKRLDDWLSSWPTTGWRDWLNKGLRPWRWPQLGWIYWCIQQTGQQLNHLLTQQSAQRRQHIVNATCCHTWEELQKNTRHLQSLAEEIGDMLHHFAAEFTPKTAIPMNGNKPQCRQATASPLSIENQQSSIENLPIPNTIYQQFIQNEEAEAITTATTLGGLGQHMQALDDTLFFKLPRLASERSAQVWQVTVVDALIATTNGQEQAAQWWQQGMDAACPLWRPDETRLQETERMQSGQFTFLCGAKATLPPKSLLDEFLLDRSEPVHWVSTNDKERLLLLRIRTGLTAEAMVGNGNSG
ncbi:MAG: hypothetical protein GY805_02905 [Chloroflexi bacterium]|nr:hypothetical protein [Chloroflexota bacterium]